MGMTMTQKILAAHAGLPSVCAGQLIEADLDLVLGNDITSPVAIHEMKMKVDGVFDKDKIALVLDHFVPNKDIKSAQHCTANVSVGLPAAMTLRNYFDVGERWESHALLPRKDHGGGRCHHRSGFTWACKLRGARRIFHRRRQHGYGCRYGNRKSVV